MYNKQIFPNIAIRQLLIAVILLIVSNTILHSQYFGRNKVQYERFDFRYIETEHFDIYYYPEFEGIIMDIGRMAERWYYRLSKIFEHEFNERKSIIFYADDADFQQTNVISGFVGEGVGGVTEGLKNRIVMPIAGTSQDTDHVLGHELVHVFQFDIAQRDTARFNMGGIPLWFIEGMAEYLSLGRDHPHTAMWLRDAIMRDDFPTITKLTREPYRYFPYRYGHAFWAFVGGRWGDDKIHQLYRNAGRIGLEVAVPHVLRITVDSLSTLWKDEALRTYQPFIDERVKPEETGTRILTADIDAGQVNIGPAISPDGNYVAFLSERELFGIDLFLADAQTGKVIRKLASASTDPHFDALRFINSSGAWSPDGKQLAFVVFAEGENRIALMDVESRRITKRLRVEGVGTISSMSWSPDGSSLVLSGMKGGRSNLYLFDVNKKQVSKLTDDQYAALHPAWSPDGQKITFVTDRSTGTDFDELTFGNMNIAFYHIDTGKIEVLPLFKNALHTNPQFSPDGKKLFFISNPDGVSNVYSTDLISGEFFQITNVATGVTGITLLAPALTVARETGEMMFPIFEGGNYSVYSLEPEKMIFTSIEIPEHVTKYTGILPPVDALDTSEVEQYIADAESGLPTEREFSSRGYRPRLELDYIGSIGAGVVVSPFGTGLVGGASLYFSDMLGDHNLFTAIQMQGTLKDIGGIVAYSNLTRRLNWGISAGRIPYFFGRGFVEPIDDVTFFIHRLFERIFIHQVSVAAQYPFSMTRRWEVSAGYSNISFDLEVESILYQFGRAIDREVTSLPAPRSLNLFEVSTALAGDNSFFGFTSPVRGQRYRFQAGATTGSLNFISLLADYRRYELIQRPFTVAMRAVHFGRYGPDSESDRIRPVFLGTPYYVRGYDVYSLTGDEFVRLGHLLTGSRILVANLEARVTVLGVERFGLINYPFLPVELAVFVDGGIAWDSERSPTFTIARESEKQIPVFSTGVSMRINLFGALIGEIFYAYPFQRPDRGAHFGFQISPGW